MIHSACAAAVLAVTLVIPGVSPGAQPREPEARDMALVGFHDLQGRGAYQPVIHLQNGRWVAYVGHHAGSAVNPLTGKREENGTSLLDVTNSAKPVLLHHIPGESGGGAQMVRVCRERDLPRAANDRTFMLRTRGHTAHEVWDVTLPGPPQRVAVVADGLHGAHTAFPVLGMVVTGSDGRKQKRDFIVVTNEALADGCSGPRQKVWVIDITDEARPRVASQWALDDRAGDFCARPGRVGAHSSHENFTPIYYRRLMFIAHFNAGVRALDIRDPYNPREIAYYVPASGGRTVTTNKPEKNIEVWGKFMRLTVRRAGDTLPIPQPQQCKDHRHGRAVRDPAVGLAARRPPRDHQLLRARRPGRDDAAANE